jgi:hypothetical protein
LAADKDSGRFLKKAAQKLWRHYLWQTHDYSGGTPSTMMARALLDCASALL